jgi:class 3 adenylate cyclase/tetratricopeptide (TPR) repeat protein
MAKEVDRKITSGNSTSSGKHPESIEKLLQERTQIDALLKEKFLRHITVLFTDIKDSTFFFASRGDIEGRLMLQKHNGLLFPIITKYQGWVVKTIGDAIMAGFDNPLAAVRAACEMQQALCDYNRSTAPGEHIHIRIGINCGLGIVEDHDIFGDVVNIAARIASRCKPDHILISPAAYAEVKTSDDINCSAVTTPPLKDMPEDAGLREVVWRDTAKKAAPAVSSPYGGAGRCWGKKPTRRGAVIGAVLLIMTSIVVVPWLKQQTRLDLYLHAYSLLHDNRPEEAKRFFEQLAETDSRRYEGLAAVCFKIGELEKARVMVETALRHFPANAYVHVISGNICFSQGKLESAAEEYAQAARQTQTPLWQQAEALNGLGRICMAQGDLEKALGYYGQAAALNPHSAVIYTNQGMALEKRGAIAEAAVCYQKALQTNPQDPIAAALSTEAQQKQQTADDQFRQERIDRLIAELVAKRHKSPPTQSNHEAWTSRPLTMSFVNLQQKGAPPLRAGEDEYFQMRLTALLQEKGRVQMVERAVFDRLLEELKLSTTDLVNPARALEIGNILAVRLIATGALMRYGTVVQATIQLTETETTIIKAAITETAPNINELVEKTAHKIISTLTKAYPVRGLIVSIKANQAELNIGADTGVFAGMAMRVLGAEKVDRKTLTPAPQPCAKTFRITAVEPGRCYAALPSECSGITRGMKIEEAVE